MHGDDKVLPSIQVSEVSWSGNILQLEQDIRDSHVDQAAAFRLRCWFESGLERALGLTADPTKLKLKE